MKNLVKVILLFFLGGIFGGLLEIGYQLVTSDHIVLGGFLYGPFRPIYGYGFVIIYLISRKVNKNPLVVFFVSFVICSIFEYSVSYMLEVLFGRTWWDYKNFYLNINGRICLMISLFWGLIGLVFVKLVIPIYEMFYEKLNKRHVHIFLIVVTLLYVLDSILSNIRHLF